MISTRGPSRLTVATYPLLPADSYRVTALLVDGVDLRELVTGVELPQARADGQESIAGTYSGVWDHEALGPDGPLMGGSERDDGLGELLWCECHNSGCWDLLADVQVQHDRVVWSGFRQEHRSSWSYDGLGPFVFVREAYEAAIASPVLLDADPHAS